jgi:hemolysin activation/secretion protein
MSDPRLISKAFLGLVLIFPLYFQSSFAYALDADLEQQKIIQRNNQAEQNLRNERNELIRQKESDEINKIGKIKSEREEFLSGKEAVDDGICKVIDDFILVGNNEFYSWNLKYKFLKKHQGKCLTKTNLNDLRKEIENYYLSKSLVLARVYFDLSKLAQKMVIIIIEEGKLDNLELHDNSKLNEKLPFRRTLQKFFAFPIAKDDVINLRDIEQGLDQMNRLSSQNAKMALEPSAVDGYSNINIDNQIGNSANINAGMDNSGNERTGKDRYKLSLNQDNLLGIGDNIYLNYTQSSNPNSNQRYSKSFYGSASIPFGYWTLGGSYSHSQYLLTTAGRATTLHSSGNSENKTYYIDRVLSRGQKYKISLKAELELNDTNSYLEDTYIAVNSRRTTNGNFYLNNTFYLKNGSLFLQAKYSKGLRWMGAKIDAPNLVKDQARAQFDSYGLYAQLNTNFNIPKTDFPLNYKLTFDSMHSEDSLFGNSQFSLGGRYTVRGFQQSIISGDSGYYFRNDLKTAMANLLPQKFSHPLFNKTSLGIFYDYGHVRNKVVNEVSDEGYMSGAGVGLTYAGKNFTWDLSYAKGLHSPEFLQKIDNLPKEKDIIYFSLNFNFGVL